MSARNPFDPRAVTSRRAATPKGALGRDRIVEVTLELLGKEGLAEVSLRRVARLLDTGPASLYAYVANLHELHVLVLDRALSEVKTAGNPESPWRERLDALLVSTFEVLVAGPGIAELAMTVVPTGPNARRILETLLGLFAEAGVDRRTAAWAADLVLLYATSIAAEQSHRRAGPDPLPLVARDFADLSATEYPHLHASREALVEGPGRARFEWAVDVLVEGILRRPATLPRRARVASSTPKNPARRRPRE